MSVQYVIQTSAGPKTVSAQRLLYDAAEFYGLSPVGISGDGLNAILKNPQTGAIQEIPFDQLANQVGMQIQAAKPQVFSVSPNLLKHRTVISSLPDPDARLAYAQSAARKEYGDAAKVVASDDGNYYVYNGNEWVSLTDEAGLGAEDIIGGAITGARVALPAVASVGAGTLGIAGSPVGAIAAGAAGGALGRAVTDASLLGLARMVGGKDAEQAISQNAENIAKTLGKEALIEGAVGGIGAGIGNVASKTLSKLGQGFISVGKPIRTIGERAETPIGRLAIDVLDPTGFTATAGAAEFLGGVVGAAGRGISKGADKLVELANKYLGTKLAQPNLMAREGYAKTIGAAEALGKSIGDIGRAAETGVAKSIYGVGRGTELVGQGLSAVGKAGAMGGERALLGQGFRQLLPQQQVSSVGGIQPYGPSQPYYTPVMRYAEEQPIASYLTSESGAVLPTFNFR